MDATQTTTAFVAVGSNVEPEVHIPEALSLLQACAPVRGISTFYITRPIARPEQDDYYNGMVMVTSGHTPRAFKYDVLRPIEAACGRVRTGDKFAARTIDLDIALFGDLVADEPGLRVPDADLRERPFLLACQLELEPAAVLPDTDERVDALVSPDAVARFRPATTFTHALRERFGL